MVMLRVRRSRFPFFGRRLRRGDTIESQDYPVQPAKWAQLIDARYFDVPDLADGTPRHEIERVFDQPPSGAPENGCAFCDFVAVTPHGLKVHVGRSHKDEKE